jgi:hypothetical protein
MKDRHSFDKNWKFQERYLPEVEDILREHSYMWVDTRIGTKHEDTKQATDMVGLDNDVSFAVRVRRGGYLKWKDLTIRSYCRGYKTELQKVKEGAGDYYLYCWTDYTGDDICAYWIINMDTLRQSGLLEKTEETDNGDGTRFIAIKEWELKKAGALLVDWSANGL